MKVESRYFDGSYLDSNSTWDREDALWKAEKVFSIITDYNLKPSTICEVGCGSGDILVHLAKFMPDSHMTGYDISPQASRFWNDELQTRLLSNIKSDVKINFVLGNFHMESKINYDLLLMLDVFEHVPDPFQFLEDTRKHAKYFIFHIPLDLSVSSILRGKPLMYVREKVGHLHFYTKDLALATLEDSGYKILDWRYTELSLTLPNRLFRTKTVSFIRKIFYSLNHDLFARVFGGESLLVLARNT